MGTYYRIQCDSCKEYFHLGKREEVRALDIIDFADKHMLHNTQILHDAVREEPFDYKEVE